MKYLFLALLLPICAHSQEWKTKCRLSDGTELNIGDSVLITDAPSLQIIKYIQPRAGYDALSTSIYLRHLGTFMPRNTYEIKEFSRVKEDGKDIPLAIIEDRYADPHNRVQYMIYADKAIAAGVVKLIKQ